MIEPGADSSQGETGAAGRRGEVSITQNQVVTEEVKADLEPCDSEATEPEESFLSLNQKYRALCDAYDNQVDAREATVDTRSTYNKNFGHIRRQVKLLIATRGGQMTINDSGDQEGINLIGLLNDINASIAGILLDARKNQEQKEAHYSEEQVAEIINILRQFDQIRKGLPRLITQLQQQDNSLTPPDKEKLEAIYRSFIGFGQLFEELVNTLFGRNNSLVVAIMSEQPELDESQLIAATSAINEDVGRRNYCLSTIKDKIIEINGMSSTLSSQLPSKLNPQQRGQFLTMLGLMNQLERRARGSFS